MLRAVRNLGSPGVCSMAISAVDNALWDLKARLLDITVADLLGRAHRDIAAYGSGGFTSYSEVELQRQLAGWIGQGMHSVKMKIGSDPPSDVARVRAARAAIGPGATCSWMPTAHMTAKRRREGGRVCRSGVTWFEEPVSSDDLEGLRLIRDRAPAGMRITAGEYGTTDFTSGACSKPAPSMCSRRMRHVARVLLASWRLGISPPLSRFRFRRTPRLRSTRTPHVVCRARSTSNNSSTITGSSRCSSMALSSLCKGRLRPDASRAGFGLECKAADMEKFKVYGNAAA